MNRFISALLAAFGLTLALVSLSLADNSPRAAQGSQGLDQDTQLDLFMSATADGPLQRSFISGTQGLHAVIEYQNGRGQKYFLRVKDLSGITVLRKETAALSGAAGRWSTPVSITNFVNTYRDNLATGGTALAQNLSETKTKCQNIPPVPAVWPPSDPNPTDDYSKWLKEVLDKLEGARSATLEMTRTAQAMASLPDVAEDAALASGLATARAELTTAETRLAQVKPKLQPETGRPDPQAGCIIVDDAANRIATATASLAVAIAALPADVSGWRLPTVSARYADDGAFLGCQQFNTDLIQIVNNQPADSPTKSIAWAVGNAGPAKLIFPSPEEADRASVGRLDVMYAGGADAMYAQTVLVDGLNRDATVGAYVTDEKCIPVEGVQMAFSIDPPEAGSVSPQTLVITGGLATTQLSSGNIAARAKINAIVSAGGAELSGRGEFSVIGPAKTVEFKGLRRNELNRAALQPKDRRLSLSVFATDANGATVADLTQVVVEIRNDPNDIATPGVLAYDAVNLGTGIRQTIELGKRAELVTYKGFSTIFPCEIPNSRCENLYLMAGTEADGRLDLVATVDGVSTESRVTIVTKPQIFLPFLSQRFDVYAPPTFITIPTVEAMATPSLEELRH
jgi:hypothetical protein